MFCFLFSTIIISWNLSLKRFYQLMPLSLSCVRGGRESDHEESSGHSISSCSLLRGDVNSIRPRLLAPLICDGDQSVITFRCTPRGVRRQKCRHWRKKWGSASDNQLREDDLYLSVVTEDAEMTCAQWASIPVVPSFIDKRKRRPKTLPLNIPEMFQWTKYCILFLNRFLVKFIRTVLVNITTIEGVVLVTKYANIYKVFSRAAHTHTYTHTQS